MNKNSKLKIAGIASVAAISLLIVGAWATFSDTANTSTSATASSLSVKIANAALSNAKNVNPGDNDITMPADSTRTPGLEHKLTFNVSNNGNTAIKTRHIVEIKTKNSSLSPDVFLLSDDGSDVPNSTKYYTTAKSNDVLAASYNETSDGAITAVKYVIMADVLDGVGENADIVNTPSKASNAYSYDLGMLATADNAYQGCEIDIAVAVQAMQYRNTSDSDWTSLFTTNIEGAVQNN